MPPATLTLILAPFVVLMAGSVMRDLATGETWGDSNRVRIDTDRIGFIVVIGSKVFVIVLFIAIILHCFGLMGDPLKPFQSILEFFGLFG